MSHQDWNPVVFTNRKSNSKKKAKAGVKIGWGKTVLRKPDTRHITKLDNEEMPSIRRVSMNVRKAIQMGRHQKSYTQKQLAMYLNVKAAIVNDYESGKAIPSNRVLQRMQAILGVRLTGKDIGSPYIKSPRKSKKDNIIVSTKKSKRKKKSKRPKSI